jgi:hypothetical protein
MKKIFSFCGITLLLSLITIPLGTMLTIKLTKVPDYQIQNDYFTESKLIAYIKDLNLKFPHIVLAQAKLESGNYKSFLFKNNNNLFGMRNPSVRVSTSKGSKYGYAYYDSWRESVLDYAFFSVTYVNNLSSEESYYNYLKTVYAENTTYVSVLKNIVKNGKLKNLF